MAENDDEELTLHDYNPEAILGTYFQPNTLYTCSLHSAIASGNINDVKRLIEKGCELNLPDNKGDTPIHMAVQYKSIHILKLLLAQPNIRCNSRNNLGETPLFISLENQVNSEIASILIDYGCDINIANNEEVTPLHLAVRRNSTDIAHRLILKGANVNSKDRDGYTPLHEAATKNQFDNVCMLLYYNASANEKTTFSEATPFLMACNYHTGTETAKYLMNYIADIDEMDAVGSTALHIAVNSRSDLALNIIERGANVNVVVDDTPCIYFSLFYETSEVFEAFWRRINYNVLLDLNYPFLEIFFHVCRFPIKQFLKCLYIIFESAFINKLLHQYMVNYEESLFSYVAHKNMPLDERIKVNYILMSHGVTVFFNDICLLHDMYGFDKSVELILTSGCCIELNRRSRFNLLVSRICYNNFEIYARSRDYFTKSIYQSDRKCYKQFYAVPEYHTLSKMVKPVDTNVCEVRSLLELSRDAIRATIFQTCDKPFVFNVYNALTKMKLPTKIKDILFLKEPIYPTHSINFSVC